MFSLRRGMVMSQRDQLTEIVSTLLMLPPGDLTADTSLARLDTSLGSVRLVLALKRLGLKLPSDRVPPTFRDLEFALGTNGAVREVSAAETTATPVPAARVNGFQGGLQVGLDIQEVGALPIPADYWEDDFYRENFDKSEIASAVVTAEPRTHLAGYWCAKEALRKCDPSFIGTRPDATAVAHDEGGRPYLVSVTSAGRTRLPHSLSISHSGQVASAVVVIGPPPPLPLPAERLQDPDKPAKPPAKQASRSNTLVVTASIVITLVMVTILVFFRHSL
jgi:phosphopantetheinyl transferase (holo-ACP synthase)